MRAPSPAHPSGKNDVAGANLQIAVRFQAFEQLTAPLRRIGAASRVTAKDLMATRKEVKALEDTTSRVGAFKSLQGDIVSTNIKLVEARRELEALQQRMRNTAGPTDALARKIDAAGRKVNGLGEALKDQRAHLQRLGGELSNAGVNVNRLGDDEKKLGDRIAATNRKLAEQKQALARALDQERRADRLRSAGDRLSGLGARASLAVTTPVVAAGFASGRETIEFSNQMANIATLIDTNVESLDRMKAGVLDLAQRTPLPLQDLTGSLYDIRSAGISASDQFRVLEGSAKLGVAGLGSTGEAADLATSSINAFGLKGREQARAFDLLFKTVKKGKTTIAELSQGFGAVAGVVANAGVQLDEYLASVAALTTTGLPAAAAHTQIRAAIAGLTRETKQSRKVMSALGAKDFKDLIAKSGGLVPALNRIRGELKGNDAAMLELFGSTEALNAVLGLTGKQGAAFNETLKDMRDGANALDPAYAKKQAEDAARLAEDMNRIEIASIKIGAIILPFFAKVAEQVAILAGEFSKLDPSTQSFIVVIALLAAAIGPILSIAGAISAALGALSAFAALLGIGLLPAIGIIAAIVAAIALLAAGAYLLWRNWDKVSAFFMGLWKEVQTAFDGGLMGVIALIWKWDSQLLAIFGQAFSNLAKWIYANWPAIWKGAQTFMWNVLWNGLLLLPRLFVQFGFNTLKGFISGLLSAIPSLKQVLVGIGKTVVSLFKSTLGIHSPSRVFMGLGGFVTDGLAIGLDRGAAAPLARMRRLGGELSGALALGSAVALPVSATGTAGAGSAAARAPIVQHLSVQITIHQQPGQDATDLARQVADEMRRQARNAAGAAYRDDA